MNAAKSVCFILFLSVVSTVYGQLPHTGLYFCSHSHNIDKRTSLTLNAGEPYQLESQDCFTLDFDFFLRNELIKFGYIFRIISNTNENFDFIINNDFNLFFVTNTQDAQLKSISSSEEWNHVSVSFDKKQNLIALHFNGETMQCPYNLKAIHSLRISFGLCDFKNFLANDVPPIILKNVQVSENHRKIHHWTLDKHGDNVVYDEQKRMPAVVQNPYWLMDNRIYWKKIAEFEANVFPQVTFDSIHNRIYILRKSELIEYAITTDSTTIFPNTLVPNDLYNQLIFDPFSKKLLLYGFSSGRVNEYDFSRKEWLYPKNPHNESDYAHHNRYISPVDSSLYLFGGYGHYKYNSKFFRIGLQNQEQRIDDFSEDITPRYLAAMGGNRTGDRLYILGGRGAEMGRQELSPKNFSDLFEVDLKTGGVKHLFDIGNKEGTEENVYSNSLIMAKNDTNFYVLAYPNGKYSTAIRLKEINIATREVKTLADSIGFYFRDVTAFCDLYFSPRLSKLIAVVAYAQEKQTSSKVNIYTLDCPPLQLKDILQADVLASSRKTAWYIGGAALCVLTLLFFLRRKLFFRRRKAVPAPVPANEVAEIFYSENNKEKSFYDFKNKAILFLGGFQVFDKNGKNITGEFTPTLKYILVLIVLYTVKSDKGISSSKLQELLWFDKTEEAARNNRSVNVRKLRVLLQSLGNIDITNENSYWTISLTDDVLLDYKEALRLIHKIQGGTATALEDILRLLELLDSGPMLPNIQFEWVDHFKNDFSNAVIDVLMQVINNPKNSFHDHQDIRLKIADCILKIDPINEEALLIKCNALSFMGKKGLAKVTFDNFAREYHLLLGESYQGSMKNFIQ